ncbi:aldehyde dehydrogenase [Marinicella pacifica]|jgi:acyl-CoA reductase-like NAD-dependent aldehyde dehydrogenase|uniref:Aldehyde dehydrogenase n=1 Tax=Marinicella pacifica TaxID=1171543 RepID=A0A917CN98_9GAMM|nr:coniferyl aldehyde dehydrogenase [Marinicella pacifica]GGF92930.1 aldehyde dehydrogenase [Marinicella pacifica]
MHTQLNKMQALPPICLDRRLERLQALYQTIQQNKQNIINAINSDYGHRAAGETLLAEVLVNLEDIKHTIKHLPRWAKADQWTADWKFWPSRCAIVPEAKGVVGIMAPWNYPFNLVAGPLTAAIAAGNRVMVKPSEVTPKTAELIQQLLAEVFTDDEVHVVLGDVDVADQFSRLPFDHLLFTGSTRVGKIIMRNAADNLTPVTLELGGKSPVLIDRNYSLDKAAKSIAKGKWFNAGQTCIAPDYVLIEADRIEALIAALKKHTIDAYPSIDINNDDFSCVVNTQHFERLQGLLKQVPNNQIIDLYPDYQNQVNRMAPVIVNQPDQQSKLMQEEIFGPILPIVAVNDLSDAIDYINRGDKPLTLYLYSNNRTTIRRVKQQTSSGSLAVNETLVHFAQQRLPFGGIGASGMGSYHGHQGFVTMSHMKSVYYQSRLNGNDLVRAPFTQLKKKIINWMS